MFTHVGEEDVVEYIIHKLLLLFEKIYLGRGRRIVCYVDNIITSMSTNRGFGLALPIVPKSLVSELRVVRFVTFDTLSKILYRINVIA